MWLPLLHTLTRNDTLASLAAGKYANIRSERPSRSVLVGADNMASLVPDGLSVLAG